jgi:hypothetical protein
MVGIPVLLVRFEAPIRAHQLKAFRGALIQHVGLSPENHRFHNHQDDTSFIYQYPTIQYKRVGQQPAVLFLGEAVDEVAKLFKQGSRKLFLNGMPYYLQTARTESWLWEPRLEEQPHTYVLRGWLPFNDANLQRFDALTDRAEQEQMLARILRGNLLSMAKGLGLWINSTLTAELLATRQRCPVDVKGTPRRCYDIRFRTNLRLQRWIGLGRHTSLGHGTLTRIQSPVPAQAEPAAPSEAFATS